MTESGAGIQLMPDEFQCEICHEIMGKESVWTDCGRQDCPIVEARAMTDQSPAITAPMSGPWMLHDMEFATVVTIEKPGRFIALCDGQHFTDEENAHHAKFIAASWATAAERDRLLTLLTKVLGTCEQSVGPLQRSYQILCLEDEIRTALDEARTPPNSPEGVGG